jgi:hypothetical protein
MTAEATSLTVQARTHFKLAARGRKRLASGEIPASAQCGHIPRISRLMALAIRCDGMTQRGDVHDYTELARLGHVTRARITQIMNLLNLAPDIQEAILFLSPIDEGREVIKEWQVRPIAAMPDWDKQRRLWADLNAVFRTANTIARPMSASRDSRGLSCYVTQAR